MILHTIFSERHHQAGAGSFCGDCEGIAVGGDKVQDWQGYPADTKRGTHDGKYTCAHKFSVIFSVCLTNEKLMKILHWRRRAVFEVVLMESNNLS